MQTKESAILQLKSEIMDAISRFRQTYPAVDINIHHDKEVIAYSYGGTIFTIHDNISITQRH